MFCIAAFIVLSVLGIFSARYRKLAVKSWGCVAKKLTLKPCDIRFDEEIKGKLLGKIILTRPALANFLSQWIDVLAFLFVALTIWSLFSVAVSGLNLFVYDTCNPQSAESCSLGGEACGVGSGGPTLWQALTYGGPVGVVGWFANYFQTIGQTISYIPDRLKTWDAKDYIARDATYYYAFDPAKPAALEIMDPDCKFCAKTFRNMKSAGFELRHNLSYLLYPIPNATAKTGYKFPNSYLLAEYIQSVKLFSASSTRASDVAPDWQLIEAIFGNAPDGKTWQEKFAVFTGDEAISGIHDILRALGYSADEIKTLDALAQSPGVGQKIADARKVVEEKIHTVKIPTIIFGGRRYGRVLGVDAFRE